MNRKFLMPIKIIKVMMFENVSALKKGNEFIKNI